MTEKMTYKESHPWITFEIDLRQLAPQTWIGLGKCAAKCEQISGAPLKPMTEKELYTLSLIRGAQATTAIEGNTLSEDEVRQILEKRSKIPPSKKYLEQEVGNILDVYNRIARNIKSNTHQDLTPNRICEFNENVLNNLVVDDEIIPGKFRQHRVTVGKYLAPSPNEMPILIEHYCNWLKGSDFIAEKDEEIFVYAIIKAIIAHLYFAWIHPFGDGNGRTARLIEFEILAQSGIPLPAAHILSNHYNATRNEYYRQLDRSSKSDNGVLDFITYAVQGFLDGLNYHLKIIVNQQIDIALRNYIHEAFREKKESKTWKRRRHLVLDMSLRPEPVKKDDIPYISKRITIAYQGKGPRVLVRDLAALQEMGLIAKKGNTYRVKSELILAFLPVRIDTH